MSETDKKRAVEEAIFRTQVQEALKALHASSVKREEATKEQWEAVGTIRERLATLEAGGAKAGGLAGGVTGIASGGIAGTIMYKLMQVLFGS